MSILIFLVVLYVLNSFTMTKLFEKAGVPAQKAWIPGVAAIEWCKIVGRKPSYALWLLFPVVNFFIYAALCIDMIRSFGKHGFWQSVIAVVFAPLPFYQIGKDPAAKYEGPVLQKERDFHLQYAEALEKKDKTAIAKLEKNNPFKKSVLPEWTEAIVFAVFAAAFIRMFIFEAYVIPTPSMEGTLKVGDFLFVSKPSYGLRLPMTVIQFPLIHNRFSNGKGLLARESYLKEPSLPYKRLPGWESVERNKPVVFNFPAGDSVIVTADRTYDIYQWRRIYPNDKRVNKMVVTRPVDKKDHYIKRCVAVPGDSLYLQGAQLYINGAPAINPEHMQYHYRVTSPTVVIDYKKIDSWGVSIDERMGGKRLPNLAEFSLDAAQVENIKSLAPDIKVERVPAFSDPTYVFPNVPEVSGGWTVDDYGPIYIPKAGTTVTLDARSIVFYDRIISVYEHNDLKLSGGKFFINGEETTTYTFKQDYYWMMGDNRHNSEDSRIWGYVPADHIVGKPVLIWFSTKNGSIRNGINWDRIFMFPGNM